MPKEIKIIRPKGIEAIHTVEMDLATRLDRIASVAERLQRVLGLDNNGHTSFFELDILSELVGEKVVGQLPNDGMGNSVKTYTLLGCIAGLATKAFDQKLAQEQTKGTISERKKDEILIDSLRDVFSNKCLVGPTSGSYGIALYIIAKKLREKCGIEVRGLPLFGAAIPSGKLKIIMEYHEGEWGDLPLAEALDRKTREQVALKKLLELVEDRSNAIDGGFFVSTNPSSMVELEKLAEIIVGEAENIAQIPEWKRDILSNLGIEFDERGNTLTINSPYADHAAGTELYAEEILQAFPGTNVDVVYPISAGAGAMGPLSMASKLHPGQMRVLLAPDPANSSWQEHRTVDGQAVFERSYSHPARMVDGTDSPAANGMGTKAQPRLNGDAVTCSIEKGINDKSAEFLPVTDVMRQIARAITTLDELHHVCTFDDPVPMQELATATSAGALLTQAIEKTRTAQDVQKLARLAARAILQRGFSEPLFLQFCFRDEPHGEALNASEVWDELKDLAKLQGERIDGGFNKVSCFVGELQNAFTELSSDRSTYGEIEGFPRMSKESSRVTVIPYTGRNTGISVRPTFVIKPRVPVAKAA